MPISMDAARLGLEAKKTLIMPGTVRYELDLAKLKQSDLDWDAATGALTVTLELEMDTPDVIALDRSREALWVAMATFMKGPWLFEMTFSRWRRGRRWRP